MSEKTIALLGQPNSGKSTLFNGLTGSRQHVGNWPGKTVERKDGSFVHKDTTYKIIDLPGTYQADCNHNCNGCHGCDQPTPAAPDVNIWEVIKRTE